MIQLNYPGGCGEMVDTQGLGPCEKSWGFKSLHPHHRKKRIITKY